MSVPSDFKKLKLSNASANNLKGLSFDLPHDQFVVVSGVSGSGKSSLAFDTIYAEGQRRYIETFSSYTRQFLDKVKKPKIDRAENVRPAIAIQQRNRITSSRSTVGSLTNIDDYLRVLWSNLAKPVCPSCQEPLKAWSAQALAKRLEQLINFRKGSTFLICAAVNVKSRKDLKTDLTRLISRGYSRYFNLASGEILEFDNQPPQLDQAGRLVVLIDRFRAKNWDLKRAVDACQQAFLLGNSHCLIITQTASSVSARPFVTVFNDPGQKNVVTRHYGVTDYCADFSCPLGNHNLPAPSKALFSYNHPIGACPECKGFGKVLGIDKKLCIPNPRLTIAENAIQCWAGPAASRERRRLLKFCQNQKIPTDQPWHQLKQDQQSLLFNYRGRDFLGVEAWFKKIERKAYKVHVRVFLARYRAQFDCPSCNGQRLKPASLAYRVDGLNIADLWAMPIASLHQWLERFHRGYLDSGRLAAGLDDLFKALLARLHYLENLGLSYLTLNRPARTLSGGETQRVNLTTAVGSELTSTHFVLDEPSVGLHPRDTDRLLQAMRSLQQRGNSLLVVEHDPDIIMSADRLLELGPAAGEQGGELIFNGPLPEWSPNLGVGPQLCSAKKSSGTYLQIKGASARNLKKIDLKIPLNRLVCLSGVSGSGKSSLVEEVIKPAYHCYKLGIDPVAVPGSVSGFEQLGQLLTIDQSPLVKSPRSNIATYSKIWDSIRALLAATDEAKLRGLSKGSFSFNAVGGRCPACKGAGFLKEDLQFLSDVYLPCELCLGQRFQPVVLEVSYKGNSVADLLNTSIAKCADLFRDSPFINKTCLVLETLGLGHLTLGHPLSELSGGEAQRLKLVPFITAVKQEQALLIFDEPTTGLHCKDVERLIGLFRELVSKGHSVLCIEHNLSVVAASDWVIDLGPEGGEAGGRVIMTGRPDDFLKSKAADCATAQYLRSYIKQFQVLSKKSNGSAPTTTVLTGSAKKISTVPALEIKGAREHNLKNISVTIPLNKTIAITGVSGSGKSTIAKDIIYAEGQRRYLDCLSPYARQFIKELKRAELDSIANLQPTICVYQHTFQPGRLSTVATMSEVYNYLRLLYAKLGVQYCPDHPDQPISPLSVDEIAAAIKDTASNSLRILAPIIKGKKGHHRAVLERAIESEISEVRVDGLTAAPSKFLPGLERNRQHNIDYVLAKFNPRNLPLDLIKEAVQSALALAGGDLVVALERSEQLYSTSRSCPECQRGFFKPDPEDLSFNSKRGACQNCQGSGLKGANICSHCQGSRLNQLARNLLLAGKNIYQACQATAPELINFLQALPLTESANIIARPILSEIQSRLEVLDQFGLDYLKLSRSCTTLSGGELQRLRVATAIGSPLTGVMYIFDEPSVGLHPLDNQKIVQKIVDLKDRGNSVIIIEHDPQSILACQEVIDIGPGGGAAGGQVVYNGPLEQFLSSQTATAQALNKQPTVVATEVAPPVVEKLEITGSHNNIKELSLSIPLQQLVSVIGVSGAGKSSLVHGLLLETFLSSKPAQQSWRSAGCLITSTIPVNKMILVDQKPLGRNSRSTPASYLGIWDEIRKLFAATAEARARGHGTSFFSYNTGRGRCQECKGIGLIRHEMSFLADAWSICESCGGGRYTQEAEEILYLGRTVSEVLALTMEEAKTVFTNHRKIQQILRYACDLGLGYLTLGQDSSTLSGGESQRLKLVAELSGNRKGHTIYLLDEPTTGLHKSDVEKLVATLRLLVQQGHTVIVIEHDADLILQSDYLIELGPGPADLGGKLIYSGVPGGLINSSTPWGQVLQKSASLTETALQRWHRNTGDTNNYCQKNSQIC